MKLKSLAAALALALVGTSSMAKTENLGSLGPPGFATFSNAFSSIQTFSDTFNFSLSGAADSGGTVGAFDLSILRDITLTSVSLSGGGLSSTLTDFSADHFSFSNLLAGSYSLVVNGRVTGSNLLKAPTVGYFGTLSTVAAPVPEPETFAMLAMGLGALALARRRKQS